MFQYNMKETVKRNRKKLLEGVSDFKVSDCC